MKNRAQRGIATESAAMKFCQYIGAEGLAWSLRRLHCPVPSRALVLEVGSGGNPYPRANVLLDAYEIGAERVEKNLIRDRPLVLGYAEQMPFRTKSFDFVIASHVLEHSSDPERFVRELMRVAHAGYIETPDGFFERLNPFVFHRLEVSAVDGQLRIFRKPSWRHATDIVDDYERKLKTREFIKFIRQHPTIFHMRFFWKDTIAYWIVNPGVSVSWPMEIAGPNREPGHISIIRKCFRGIARQLFSQGQRNRNCNVIELRLFA